MWAPLSLLLALLLPPPLWGGPPDRALPERQPEPGPLQPFDLLYASGVAAYYRGDYERAVRDLEVALRSHRRLREIRARCARYCAARRPLAPPGVGAGAELPFFRALLERARCYRGCQTQRLGGPASRHRVSEDVRSDFQRRVPYNYLQRAYIKVPSAHANAPCGSGMLCPVRPAAPFSLPSLYPLAFQIEFPLTFLSPVCGSRYLVTPVR